MTADGAIESFVREIGWTADLRDQHVPQEFHALLNELSGLFGREVHWTSDAIGTISVDNGEKWLAQFRTCIDTPIIWRVYERVDKESSGQRFKISRRSAELNWNSIGYFSKWPSNWTADSGGALQTLVQIGQNLEKQRKN
jgi:hypothetical protein